MHISLGVQRLAIVHWNRKCSDTLPLDQAEIPAILSGRVEFKGTALGKHVSNPNIEGTHTPGPAGCTSVAVKGAQEGPGPSPTELLAGGQ